MWKNKRNSCQAQTLHCLHNGEKINRIEKKKRLLSEVLRASLPEGDIFVILSNVWDLKTIITKQK